MDLSKKPDDSTQMQANNWQLTALALLYEVVTMQTISVRKFLTEA